jgi:hypothetical protein
VRAAPRFGRGAAFAVVVGETSAPRIGFPLPRQKDEAISRDPASADAVATKLVLAKALDESEGLALAIRCASPVIICDLPSGAMLDVVEACRNEVVFGDASANSTDFHSDGPPSPARRNGTNCLHLNVTGPPKPVQRDGKRRRALAALSLALPVIAFSPLAACPGKG